MADASRPPRPFDWGEAFSALPQDAPPASRWPAIAAALDARARTRRQRRLGLAIAAGVCALAALPLTLLLRDAPETPPSTTIATAPAPALTPTIADAPSPTAVATVDPLPADSVAASLSTAQADAGFVGVASRAPSHTVRRHVRTVRDATATPATGDPLETLHAASAHLESLLALTRDPRVESGPAAALAADYEAVLAEIDARLAQPGLSQDAQRTLWQARVSTLESVAGLESQFRLLAAEGDSFDGALVSID
jgi:hypothetical protein